MGWRALLRVVDFSVLLTAQANLAEALERTAASRGADSDEAKTLRAGFNLLAKVLFTRRAGLSDVHDLAWLDHLVVSRDSRPSKVWEGDVSRDVLEALAMDRGRLGELLPRRRMTTWAEIPVIGFGSSEPIKLERGLAGPLRIGVVNHEGCLELMAETSPLATKTKERAECLRDIWRLAMTARQSGTESCALVFAASSL